jgi:hypothetical protein
MPGQRRIHMKHESDGRRREIRQDNQVIREMVVKAQAEERFSYLHSAPAGEPLLWLPHLVAWAVGRGGDWKRRCGEVELRDIEPWRS